MPQGSCPATGVGDPGGSSLYSTSGVYLVRGRNDSRAREKGTHTLLKIFTAVLGFHIYHGSACKP